MSEPRKVGRPKADEPSVSISTWLKKTDCDRLIQLAKQRDQSVSSMVRRLVTANIPTK